MFEFRLIIRTDGNQVIDRRLKTPYESLDLVQFLEYLETEEVFIIWTGWKRKLNRKRNI